MQRRYFIGQTMVFFEQEVLIISMMLYTNIMSLFYYTSSKEKCSMFMELIEKDLTFLMQNGLQNFNLDFHSLIL